MVAHERSIFVLRTHSGECRQSDLAEQIRIGLTPPRSGDDASCDDLTHCPRQAGPVARGDSSLVRLDQHFRHLRVEGMSGPSKFQDFRHSVRNDPSHKNGHRIGNACRTISSLGAVFFSALCCRTKALGVRQYSRGLVQCCSILRDAFVNNHGRGKEAAGRGLFTLAPTPNALTTPSSGRRASSRGLHARGR
jgi:hypothetical protein